MMKLFKTILSRQRPFGIKLAVLVLILTILTAAGISSQSSPGKAQVKSKGDVTSSDCERLPTKEEFIKTAYDREAVRKIQLCLIAKGYLNAPAHGFKGPMTIAALEKYHARKTAAASASGTSGVDCNNLPSKELFVKQQYDAETIKIIQGCLAAQGYYKGAVDGRKGKTLIDALARAQAAHAGLKRANAGANCANLPSQKAFIKGKYSKKSIEIIQGCLWEKGYYTGPIDGLRGPLTIAALGRLSTGAGTGDQTINPGGPFVSYSLTSNDFEELKGANDILDQLEGLKDETYQNNDELKKAVKESVKEVTDQYDGFLSLVLTHVEQMKYPKLTEEDFKSFKEAEVPDTVTGVLRDLQDEKFSDKSRLVREVKVRLNQVSDPYRFLVDAIMKDVGKLGSGQLPESFFDKLEAKRIPESVLKKVKQIQDVEYINARLFLNTLKTGILDPMKKNKELDQETSDLYESLLLAKATKEHQFEKSRLISWSGWSCGCSSSCGSYGNGDSFSSVYGFYPFWHSGNKEKVDFSSLNRIGYFGVTFNEKGEIAERLDWKPERAAFVDKAHQYRAYVDLVVYRNDWQNWPKFVSGNRKAFIEKLTNSIVDAVDESRGKSFAEKVKSMLSFGSRQQPSMGDGVTLFFDGYPEDAASETFFREFVRELRTKLKVAHKDLNVVLSQKAAAKVVDLNGDVDRFLVLMEEPVADTEKMLRKEVEDLFRGKTEDCRKALRKIIPVISSSGHDFDKAAEQKLNDDLIYFQDNFGGVGFWPLPKSGDSGAAELNRLVRDVFMGDGNQDFVQGSLVQNAPWFGKIVCPHRWVFRITFDILLFVLLVYTFLSFWIFELQDFYRKHFWWFFGTGALALIIQLCMFLGDPYYKGKTAGILAVALLVVILVSVWGYVRKMNQEKLP